jgi:hypothetical protein
MKGIQNKKKNVSESNRHTLIQLMSSERKTRQITLRCIEYSEFIPLALTITQFTVPQLLPSAVSQLHPLLSATAGLQLNGYSLSSNSLTTHSLLRVRERERERESYFTTGGLPPISSSWRRVP